MLLSDRDIRGAVAGNQLHIRPYNDQLVQPASMDVRLGAQLRVFRSVHIPVDPAHPPADLTDVVLFTAEHPFLLVPGMFALGTTWETVTLPADMAAQLDGKSTLGRLGLLVHSTAGWVDPGFSGELTLELFNTGPLVIELRPGMAIGQLCFFSCSSAAERPYGSAGLGSRYMFQNGPTAAR